MIASFADEDLKEFDKLTNAASSSDQVKRIAGRIDLSKFVEKHGKDKCDAMFQRLQGRDRKRNSRPPKPGRHI